MREERFAKLEADKERRRAERSGQSVASTSWVVSGEHSASGLPLLVVEPHTSPNDLLRYSVSQFEIMGENLTGSTFLGVPGLFNGRTTRSAWG
mmetsp:Transcript_35768/g.47064  ORF Transcript_35768/g.47064 Transcript_35768/m.47064 type:complete len:93 (+) Transcript_35768:999-1277(+)